MVTGRKDGHIGGHMRKVIRYLRRLLLAILAVIDDNEHRYE